MSSNNEYAIQVQDVSKIYKLYDKPIDRLKESLSLTHKNYHKDFFALSDISFNVKKGETVGIIGTNGSGKSTILKIITGVLTPTSGQVRVSGVISALLELGAGFNMDYTGIENIYMNGTMMGFSKKQMDEKLPDILEFADIGDFVYQPVKTYSSGMFVKLAFAVAAHLDSEIMVMDEVLAVGDMRPFLWETCSSSPSATAAWRRSGRTEPPFLWLPTTWAVSSNTVTGWCF